MKKSIVTLLLMAMTTTGLVAGGYRQPSRRWHLQGNPSALQKQLWNAAWTNDVNLAQNALNKGADINEPKRERTSYRKVYQYKETSALAFAISQQHYEVARFLIKKGANTKNIFRSHAYGAKGPSKNAKVLIEESIKNPALKQKFLDLLPKK